MRGDLFARALVRAAMQKPGIERLLLNTFEVGSLAKRHFKRLLAMPPDRCSDKQRAARPARRCNASVARTPRHARPCPQLATVGGVTKAAPEQRAERADEARHATGRVHDI